MRSFAETLPTLRQSGNTQSAAQRGAFDPAVIAKALATRRTGRTASQPKDGAETERSGDISIGRPSTSPAGQEGAGQENAAPREADETSATTEPSAGTVDEDSRPRSRPRAPRPAIPIPSIDVEADRKAASDDLAALQAELAEVKAHQDELVAAATARAAQEAEVALTEARKEWVGDEAERLAESLTHAIEAMRSSLSGAFAQAVAPILEDAAREAALEAFQGAIERCLAGENAPAKVCVKGANDLLESLKGRTAHLPLTFERSESAELSATIDGTTVQTTLAPFVDTLKKIVSEADDRQQ